MPNELIFKLAWYHYKYSLNNIEILCDADADAGADVLVDACCRM